MSLTILESCTQVLNVCPPHVCLLVKCGEAEAVFYGAVVKGHHR